MLGEGSMPSFLHKAARPQTYNGACTCMANGPLAFQDRARAHAAAAGGKQNKKQGQPAAAAPTLPAGVPENSRKWTITMIKQWLDSHGATYGGNETKQDLVVSLARRVQACVRLSAKRGTNRMVQKKVHTCVWGGGIDSK